ncbi:insulin-like growth factor-binding protein complex acid labile subunit [Cephus cinctus]|uniref:Insulin-like growth factor-binding protein complex acid labile subunit n=1 Tax=Cephus cinctus TaxID=211228 RepID=A0AAJ7FSL2_CEPCN|nr:insulin-like growth factor-binding protein complex acid labile subunit [Cephus cinctus]
MWLLILLLAFMASGSACPEECSCHAERAELSHGPVELSCLGKTPQVQELPGDARALKIDSADEYEVMSLLDEFENASHALPLLDELVLTNCSLEYLNVSWTGLGGLRALNLSSNNFVDLNDVQIVNMVKLRRLTSFDVSSNLLRNVSANAFRTLATLVYLSLRRNVITNVSEAAFRGLALLENLNLADNRLSWIPDGALTPLDSLQKLDLSGNQLQVLGARWFESLGRLRELDVSRNGLARAASGALQPLPGLSVLRLAENPLRERDVSLLLGTGRRLETVDASRTGLARVPAALTRSVRALRLAGNLLTSIRSGDLDSYPLLRMLDISDNRLSDVEEDALGRLEVLEDLNMSGNVLTEVPRSLPSSLTILNLEGNRIGTLRSNDLQGLYNLRSLMLNHNAITLIQEGSLGQLPALVELDISENPIKTLPANTLNGPSNLATLRMSGLTSLEWDQQERADMAFPVPTPERLVTLDVSYSPVLAAQLLADNAALSACKSLLVLNMIGTNVTTVRSDLLYFLPQLRTLGLSGNEWNCTEDLYWLGEWIRQHAEYHPPADCAEPANLTGYRLYEMPAPPTPLSTAKTSTTTIAPITDPYSKAEVEVTSGTLFNAIDYNGEKNFSTYSYMDVFTSSTTAPDLTNDTGELLLGTSTTDYLIKSSESKMENRNKDSQVNTTVSDNRTTESSIMLYTSYANVSNIFQASLNVKNTSTESTTSVKRNTAGSKEDSSTTDATDESISSGEYPLQGNETVATTISTYKAKQMNTPFKKTLNKKIKSGRYKNKKVSVAKHNSSNSSKTFSRNIQSNATRTLTAERTKETSHQAATRNLTEESLVLADASSNTLAEELSGQATDSGARVSEPPASGAHPGMLVLAGAALGAAAALTVVLSRRATIRRRDRYHRHENIEVHTLTPAVELW